ncbi:hypothetical protein HDV04_004957 [Boothiomyces sp. JEL0838]|nr:hypothetical protein HDV04_004957 [Boothiomyces sp. JEL0838]
MDIAMVVNSDQMDPQFTVKSDQDSQLFKCRGCDYTANRRDTLQRHRNRRGGRNECILSEILDFLKKVKENQTLLLNYYENLEDDTRETLHSIKNEHSSEFHQEWAKILSFL